MINETMIYSQIEKHDRGYYENIINKFIEKIEKAKKELGRGRTAHVLILEDDSKYCLKIVTDKDLPRNTVEEELKILDILAETEIPISHPIRATLNEDGNDYLLMETVKVNETTSMSLEDLILKNQANLLPNGFDFKNFFSKLKKIIDKMNNELNIHHRDLHLGNIMMNENGDPVIIDVGDAEKVLGGDEQAATNTIINGKETIVPSDMSMAHEAQIKVRDYLLGIGWKKNN